MLIHKVSLQGVKFCLRCALSATTIIGSIFPFRTQIPTVWFTYSDIICECLSHYVRGYVLFSATQPNNSVLSLQRVFRENKEYESVALSLARFEPVR